MTKGKFYKITKGLKCKREKGQTYLRTKEKKDNGTNKNPIIYQLTCGARGWTDMSTKGQLSEK
jgi:hypothetical protein